MFSTAHIHPMLVHFPIALLCFGFFLELCYLIYRKEVCLTRAGLYLLIGGALAAIVTVASGLIFTPEMEGQAGAIRDTHETIAIATTIIATLAAILRIYLARQTKPLKGLATVALILYGLAAIGVMGTGYFGGSLVYNFMMPI